MLSASAFTLASASLDGDVASSCQPEQERFRRMVEVRLPRLYQCSTKIEMSENILFTQCEKHVDRFDVWGEMWAETTSDSEAKISELHLTSAKLQQCPSED